MCKAFEDLNQVMVAEKIAELTGLSEEDMLCSHAIGMGKRVKRFDFRRLNFLTQYIYKRCFYEEKSFH